MTTERKTLFETGTISNVDAKKRLTDKQIVDAMYQLEQKHPKMLEESKSDKDPKEVFQYAHFICVRSKPPVVITREDVGAIQKHKETCPFCSEIRAGSSL